MFSTVWLKLLWLSTRQYMGCVPAACSTSHISSIFLQQHVRRGGWGGAAAHHTWQGAPPGWLLGCRGEAPALTRGWQLAAAGQRATRKTVPARHHLPVRLLLVGLSQVLQLCGRHHLHQGLLLAGAPLSGGAPALDLRAWNPQTMGRMSGAEILRACNWRGRERSAGMPPPSARRRRLQPAGALAAAGV